MAAFNYLALNNNGEEVSGVLEADSVRLVRQKLREQQLIPLEVTPVIERHLKSSPALMLPKRKKVGTAELALLTRQMATLLEAGLPLEEVLVGVAEQTEKPHIKSILLAVRARVLEGHPLATGMKEFPKAFPAIYRATVAAGEQSGCLEKVLLRLADFTEKQQTMQQKIKHALLYPTLMTVVSLAIVAFLLAYVVPKMVDVFQESGQQLPFLTQVLLIISDIIHNYGFYILLVMIGCGFGLRYLLKQPGFRQSFHQFLLRIPLLGSAIKVINTARFSRTFGILSASSVPILEAMQTAMEVVNILPLRNALNQAIHQVREGGSVHGALKKTGYFPAMSIHLIASGEASSQLEAMLERAANNQDRDMEILIQSVLSLFEPLLILLMGSIVLFIVLAVLLPIFQMNQFTT